LDNVAHRDELGRKGKEAVHQHFHAARMAQETVAVYEDHAGAKKHPAKRRNAIRN
jgi:hypothetical protein